jgi:uncharacterized protein (TIGR03067 family)
MRFAPLVTAFALAAGLIGFSTLSGQPPKGKADKSPAAELAKFRGDWMIAKIETPPGDKAPSAEFLKGVGIKVNERGVVLTISDTGGRSDTEYALLKVDPTKTPAQIDLTIATEKYEPQLSLPTAIRKGEKAKNEPYLTTVLQGIYKFEGDTLVLALPNYEHMARPTEFKAVVVKHPTRVKDGIDVVYLTKKK